MARNNPNSNMLRAVLWSAAVAFGVALLVLAFAPAAAYSILMVLVLGVTVAAIITGRYARRPKFLADTPTTNPDAVILQPQAGEIFERLPDPVMLVDGGGRVLFANAAMRAVAGTDTQGKQVSAVLRTPVVLQAVDRAIQSGVDAAFAFAVHVPVERHYQATVTRTAKAPLITALVLHDTTAIVRAEQARVDFVANASHELRTPLAAVSGFIDTLRGHAKDDAQAREQFLEIMSVEAGRMSRLIDDLLSLNRIELNEHVPPSGKVDAAGLVRDAVNALAPLAQADGVTVSIDDPGDIPAIVGERDELIQLFQNLIQNAIKYGRENGHVWITLSSGPNLSPTPRRSGGIMVSIKIKDDGEGIPHEAIPRLTERFYRVNVKRSRERGGTGLGLAIVKHIVNRHQGRMQIESELGVGTSFTIHLPAAE
ncbi:MAG TPA: ATP-binding protein [Rhizomicrobium sp.]|nr:ATP-binding protein [Rhizomicrobium sp.]